MKIVGERLKTLRERVGLSQMRMAKTFGAGQSSIYRYESGEAGVPAELVRISLGLEDKEDLISDISQALDAIAE